MGISSFLSSMLFSTAATLIGWQVGTEKGIFYVSTILLQPVGLQTNRSQNTQEYS